MDTQTRHFFDPAKLPSVYHPGETLYEKMQEMGVEVEEFAMKVSIPEEVIVSVIKGQGFITPKMTETFEMITKIPAYMWLRHQKSYDDFIAHKKTSL